MYLSSLGVAFATHQMALGQIKRSHYLSLGRAGHETLQHGRGGGKGGWGWYLWIGGGGQPPWPIDGQRYVVVGWWCWFCFLFCYGYCLVVSFQPNPHRDCVATTTGHYTSFCRDADRTTWIFYNDKEVGVASPEDVLVSQAFLLFYEIKDWVVQQQQHSICLVQVYRCYIHVCTHTPCVLPHVKYKIQY